MIVWQAFCTDCKRSWDSDKESAVCPYCKSVWLIRVEYERNKKRENNYETWNKYFKEKEA